MVENKNVGRRTIAIMVTLIMLSSFAMAINVNYPIEVLERQLQIFPNEEKEVNFLVDLAASEGNNVQVTIIKGSEVISLVGSNIIPIGTGERVSIPFKVTAPDNAGVGSIFPVTIIFKSVGTEGTLGIGTTAGGTFNVKIVERPKEETKIPGTLIILLLVIAVIILALIIYFIVRKRR